MNNSENTTLELIPSIILDNSTLSPVNTTIEPGTGGLNLVARLTLTFMFLQMLITLVGNTLVLTTVVAFSTLRDITSIFIANLAVADLFIGLIHPFQIAFFFYPSLELNKQACILRYTSIVFSCNASACSLMCTVLDRFVAIAYPLRYNQFITEKRVYVVIALIWIIDIVYCLLPHVALNDFEMSPFCLYELVIRPEFRRMNHLINLVLALFMFLIYLRIFIIARGHAKRIQTEESQHGVSHTSLKRQSYVITALVVLFFQIAWLPFLFVQLTMYGPSDVTVTKVTVANFCVMLGLFNSVNPIIYAWKNRQFRRAFVKILRLKLKDDFSLTDGT